MPFWSRKDKDNRRSGRPKDIAPDTPPSTTQSSQPGSRPGDPFRSQGDQLALNDDYNGAVVMYNSALQQAPHDIDLLLSRSLAHMMSTPQKLDLALKDANDALELNPNHPQAWMQKGDVLMKQGDAQAAVGVLTNAVRYANRDERFTAQRRLAEARTLAAGTLVAATSSISQQPSPQSPPTILAPPILPPESPRLATPSSNSQTGSNESHRTTPVLGQQRVSAPPVAPASAANPPLPRIPQEGNTASSTGTPSRVAQDTSSRRAPVDRQSTATTLPFRQELFDNLGDTQGPPPAYTANMSDPNVVSQRLTALEQVLSTKSKGSLSINPYTLPGNIDAVRLLYRGMTSLELTSRELGTQTYLHASFAQMALIPASYPGSTFLDSDCETLATYEGKSPGTVTVAGYSEEYRAGQLTIAPLLNLTLEATTVLPEISLSRIVERLANLKLSPYREDNTGLEPLVNRPSQGSAALDTFPTYGTRQAQIDYICMGLNKSKYDAAARFPDLSKAGQISSYFIGSRSTGTGLRNFLYQILLGCELLVRLRNEPITTSYTGIVTDSTSALLVLGSLWMAYVSVTGPTNQAAKDSASSYTFVANRNRTQAEALIRFGEGLNWPYMDEARNCIETAYNDMVYKRLEWNGDMWDWMFNLVLPGKIYRHKIMAALVFASPSVRQLKAAPFYDNGLIIKESSYWPKRTVLGRVLGGVQGVKSICGWVGPLPAPQGNLSGWIRLNARSVPLPVPVKADLNQDILTDLGFDDPGVGDRYALLESLLDPQEWLEAMVPARPANDNSKSELKFLILTQISTDQAPLISLRGLPPEQYRASLEFEINSASVTYTLYSNPVFVAAPPCVGTHVLHKRQREKYFKNLVKAVDLKQCNVTINELLIIDALGRGEEVVARAWCSERARNALVRRGNDCCFSCASAVAIGRTGLGFNVIILSQP